MGRERRKRQRVELHTKRKALKSMEWDGADKICLMQPVCLPRALAETKTISKAVPQQHVVPGLCWQLALGVGLGLLGVSRRAELAW